MKAEIGVAVSIEPITMRRDRQRGPAGVRRKLLARQARDGEDHRHLRAKDGLGRHKNQHIAAGEGVVEISVMVGYG